MLQLVHVEFLESSERVKDFAPAEAGQPAPSPRIVFILDKMST